ncbi:MAG: glycosyltransferase [Phycisphaerae bacterium]|nr:glycosyltransferase [Phycisphaerae bacterium]
MAAPRVSVIIPNFNNGTAETASARNLIGALFESLERTLAHETVPFEIVVADDGSTDDSLATCREWSQRQWSDGRSFLRLIELSHSGVLSRVLNVLERESRGEFLARLDGDVLLRTPNWLSELVRLFESDVRIGVIGGTQLLPDGTVHAFGDDLWSPRGYRHVARGVALSELTSPPREREVDSMMGCFYATRRAVREQIGGYDERVLRGQTEEYSTRARRAGWKIVATSRVVFEHWHVDRLPRANRADRPDALDAALDQFCATWGFDRLAPDLEVVRERYLGTPLWWRDHKQLAAPAAGDEWERIGSDPVLAQRLAEEFDLAALAIRAAEGAVTATHIGAVCGCLAHAIARADGRCDGFEERGAASEAAARSLRFNTSARPPTFVAVDDLAHLPLPDASCPLILVFGVLERYWNPVGLLRECRRLVTPNGAVMLRTELRSSPLDDPDAALHPFTSDEFLALLRHVGTLELFGFAPRITASGWLECCLRGGARTSGRGYFSRVVTPLPSHASAS